MQNAERKRKSVCADYRANCAAGRVPDKPETRLRRMANRSGLALVKSRRRDAGAIGFGQFHIRGFWSERVIGVLPSGGLGLVEAPASKGGAERFAVWFGLTNIEQLLSTGKP